jgi:hypothetical protein
MSATPRACASAPPPPPPCSKVRCKGVARRRANLLDVLWVDDVAQRLLLGHARVLIRLLLRLPTGVAARAGPTAPARAPQLPVCTDGVDGREAARQGRWRTAHGCAGGCLPSMSSRFFFFCCASALSDRVSLCSSLAVVASDLTVSSDAEGLTVSRRGHQALLCCGGGRSATASRRWQPSAHHLEAHVAANGHPVLHDLRARAHEGHGVRQREHHADGVGPRRRGGHERGDLRSRPGGRASARRACTSARGGEWRRRSPGKGAHSPTQRVARRGAAAAW